MKVSGKIDVYINTFIIVMIGYIFSLITADFITDLVSGIVIFPKDYGIGVFAAIDYLTPMRISWLVYAVSWFLVCILVNYRSSIRFDEGENLRIKSQFFFILWFISSLAIVIGFIIKRELVATISWESLLDELFAAAFWALTPTIAALLGVSTKSHNRG